jgi:4-amino-4-deoxy-L-arabinose transferase-like glycosyltransferase
MLSRLFAFATLDRKVTSSQSGQDRARRRTPARLFASAAVVAWVLLWFAGLGVRALGEPDEGRYAEVAREMLHSGDWITPTLNGFTFFDKPALQYWATAMAYALLGIDEAAARLWPALTGLLSMLAVAWAGKRLYGLRCGVTAAIVLGSSLLFTVGAHIATLDLGVAAFLNIAICFFLVAQFDPAAAAQRRVFNLLGWACLALAVLSKGLIGVVLPAITLLVFMICRRDWRLLERLNPVLGLALLLAIATPWFVLVCLRNPSFFEYFFIHEHFQRFLTNQDNRVHSMFFFVPVVVLGLSPWVAFLRWPQRAQASASERAADVFLMCWVGVVFVFFSLSHSKLPFYILPVFPALALLIARSIGQLQRAQLQRRLAWIGGVAALLTLVGATLAALEPGAIAQLQLRSTITCAALGMALLAAGALLGAGLLARGRGALLALCCLGFGALAGWQSQLIGQTELGDDLSAQPTAALMQPYLTADSEVFMVDTYLRGLPFYLRRLSTLVGDPTDDIAPGLSYRPAGYLRDVPAFETRWRTAPGALAVVNRYTLPQLQHDAIPMQVLGTIGKQVVIRQPETTQHGAPAAGPAEVDISPTRPPARP